MRQLGSIINSMETSLSEFQEILPGSSVNGIFQARVLEWDAKPTSIQKKKKKAGAKQHLKVVAKLPEGLSLGKEMPPATEQPDFFAFGPHEGS